MDFTEEEISDFNNFTEFQDHLNHTNYDTNSLEDYSKETCMNMEAFKDIREYNPPINFYTQIKCNIPHKNRKHLVGKAGKHFNEITKASKVEYIWLNASRNTIEIWGPEEKLRDAKTQLLQRITKVNSPTNRRMYASNKE
jgi:hypothetical protein